MSARTTQHTTFVVERDVPGARVRGPGNAAVAAGVAPMATKRERRVQPGQVPSR